MIHAVEPRSQPITRVHNLLLAPVLFSFDVHLTKMADSHHEEKGPQIVTASPRYSDCTSCRIIGTASLAGVGAYSLWGARAAAPGSPGQKKIVAGLGVGTLCLNSWSPLITMHLSLLRCKCLEMVQSLM